MHHPDVVVDAAAGETLEQTGESRAPTPTPVRFCVLIVHRVCVLSFSAPESQRAYGPGLAPTLSATTSTSGLQEGVPAVQPSRLLFGDSLLLLAGAPPTQQGSRISWEHRSRYARCVLAGRQGQERVCNIPGLNALCWTASWQLRLLKASWRGWRRPIRNCWPPGTG